MSTDVFQKVAELTTTGKGADLIRSIERATDHRRYPKRYEDAVVLLARHWCGDWVESQSAEYIITSTVDGDQFFDRIQGRRGYRPNELRRILRAASAQYGTLVPLPVARKSYPKRSAR